jgi:hypothetical protein
MQSHLDYPSDDASDAMPSDAMPSDVVPDGLPSDTVVPERLVAPLAPAASKPFPSDNARHEVIRRRSEAAMLSA